MMKRLGIILRWGAYVFIIIIIIIIIIFIIIIIIITPIIVGDLQNGVCWFSQLFQ